MTVGDEAAGRRDALVGRLVGAALGAVDLLNVYLGGPAHLCSPSARPATSPTGSAKSR